MSREFQNLIGLVIPFPSLIFSHGIVNNLKSLSKHILSSSNASMYFTQISSALCSALYLAKPLIALAFRWHLMITPRRQDVFQLLAYSYNKKISALYLIFT